MPRPLLPCLFATAAGDHTPDADLLRRFARGGDAAALELVVRRHAAAVWAACRRILPEADAADAFQATFLVLARKAGAVRGPSAGGWLHRVAVTAALKRKAAGPRRPAGDAAAPDPGPAPPDRLARAELAAAVHEELARLPDRYRLPVVLCDLEGETRPAAAARLGWPVGSVASRLSRARALLRRRLTRRGFAPAGSVLVLPLAAVPGPVLSAAVAAATGAAAPTRPASLLASGVLSAMRTAKLKLTAAALATAALVVAAGFGAYPAAAQPGPGPGAAAKAGPPPAAKAGPPPAEGVVAAVARLADRLKAPPPPDRPGDRLGLFLLDLGTGEVTPAAAAADPDRGYLGSPGWSADGRRIYFDASPGFGKWAATRVRRLDLTAAGVERRDLLPGNCPTPSPDGKSVAYLINYGADPGVYVADADGGGPRRLGGYGIPRWSPDGKHLLVVPFANPCEPTVMDPATGEEQPVRLAGHRIYSVPSWAGAGTLAAVVRSDTGFSVALVDVTTPGEARVAETLWKRGDGLAAEVEPLYPVYDPWQRRGAFVGREARGQALYAVAPGRAPRRLEAGPLDPKVASLALSPDGRFVLFCADRPTAR